MEAVQRREKKIRMYLRCLLAGILLLMFGPGVNEVTAEEQERATETQLHALKSTDHFYVGEAFTYELLIRLENAQDVVELDEVEQSSVLAVQLLGQTKVEKDGVTVVSVKYQMVPLQTGSIGLPVITAKVGSAYVTTEEEDYIEAKKLENFPGMQFFRTLPDRNIYVGEPFLVDYTWVTPLNLNNFSAVSMQLPLLSNPAFKSMQRHNRIAQSDKSAIGLPVGNTRMIGRYRVLLEEKKRLNSVHFSRVMLPKQAGKYTLDTPTLLTSYTGPTENTKWRATYPSYFNNNFFGAATDTSAKRFYTESESGNLNILPLPDTGKPTDFYGCVGACEVRASVNQKVVRVGEPITLTVTIQNYAHPEVFELADLSAHLAFKRQFSFPARAPRGKTQDGEKTYIYTLRPLSQDVTAVPPIRVPYFDPKTQAYAVAESPAIAITVKASEVVTAYDALLSDGDSLRNEVRKNSEGIRANVTKLGSTGPWNVVFLCVLLGPPFGFLSVYVFTQRRRLWRDDPARARALEAMKQYRTKIAELEKNLSQLGEMEKLQKLDSIVRSYFSDSLGMSPYAHSFMDVKNALPEGDDIEVIEKVYRSTELFFYKEQEIVLDVDSLIRQSKKCIGRLNKRVS